MGRCAFRASAACATAIVASSQPARADDGPPPTFSLSARDTLDSWVIVDGGLRQDAVLLNKIQVSASLQGDAFGLPGFSLHGQVLRVDGASPSARIGDIQTVDNIDAEPVTRLFEAWVEKKFGGDTRSFAVRAGLIDLNADFDSIQTASLFVDSSHGIGADLSRSGVDGPSIFPVTAAGLRLSWLPSKSWTLRAAVFDGVAGDPDRPRAFVAERLAPRDGALLIGQVDYHLSDAAKIEIGGWHYTRTRATVGPPGSPSRNDQGAYVSIEGPVPDLTGWSAWLRAGASNGEAQPIDGYLGLGVVRTGTFKGRQDDRVGLAIARVFIGPPAQASAGLPRAETSVEASYQIKLGTSFAVQPDAQYVIHSAGIANARNAVVVGLRFIVTGGFPKKAPAADSADPTVPPDGPQPGDDTKPAPSD